MKRAISLILSGIGLLTILFFVAGYLISGFVSSPDEHDFNIQSEKASPKGDFRAVHYLGMGGGAAGWCNEVVSIEPVASHKAPPADKFISRVFTISCGSKVDFDWLGDHQLHIDFAPKQSQYGSTVYLRNSDQSQKVSIEYSYKP